VILTAAKKEAKAMKDAAQKEIARWEAEKKDIYKTRTFEPIIKLNVGGTSFSTTLKTLTSIPGSTLGKMFSGRHELPKDQNGAYFIDRDPLPFAEIITFLRSPTEYHAPVIDVELKAKLLTEAAFFGVKQAMFPPARELAPPAPFFPVAEVQVASCFKPEKQLKIAQASDRLWYMSMAEPAARPTYGSASMGRFGEKFPVSVCKHGCGYGCPTPYPECGVKDFTNRREVPATQPKMTPNTVCIHCNKLQ